MSLSLVVKGLRDMDNKFKNMLELKKICEKAETSYPEELREYFGEEIIREIEAGSEYFEDNILEEMMLEIEIPQQRISDGYRVEVKDIPKECKTILFQLL